MLTKSIGGDPVATRSYTKDAVVVTHASGAQEEHPYVAVPLLFKKDSDELLGATSRDNVAKVAQMLKDLGSATFAIEGHASAEGNSKDNFDLSKKRAAKIQTLLREQGVQIRLNAEVSELLIHPATDESKAIEKEITDNTKSRAAIGRVRPRRSRGSAAQISTRSAWLW